MLFDIKKHLFKAVNDVVVGATPCACPIVDNSAFNHVALSKKEVCIFEKGKKCNEEKYCSIVLIYKNKMKA